MSNPLNLEAVYFPGWFPSNQHAISAACIYFARVHFVTPTLNAGSPDSYTNYLRDASKKSVKIQIIGSLKDGNDANIQRMTRFWRFVKVSGPLIGEVIRYHPSLLTQDVPTLAEKLCSGGLPLSELTAFVERGKRESELHQQWQRWRVRIRRKELRRPE